LFKDHKKNAATDTLVGQGTLAEGKLVCEASLRLEGEYHGDIACKGEVIIGEYGIARANIEAQELTVAGKIYGDIKTFGKLTITPSGLVQGNVTAKSLIILDGGTLNGHCLMDKGAEPVARPYTAEEKSSEVKDQKAKQAG
jgi:cytoskeletal protein CcmA (bactofilin family)